MRRAEDARRRTLAGEFDLSAPGQLAGSNYTACETTGELKLWQVSNDQGWELYDRLKHQGEKSRSAFMAMKFGVRFLEAPTAH